MASNLTGSTIAATYTQILHVDGGPAAAEKTVYSGAGTATALKVGTLSASVDNIKLDGNTISTTDTNGNLTLAPDGTGNVGIANAAITGGTISGTSTVLQSYAAASLAAIGNAVNTTGKAAGKMVWDSTNNKMKVATGSSANSTWVDADGLNAVTPA